MRQRMSFLAVLLMLVSLLLAACGDSPTATTVATTAAATTAAATTAAATTAAATTVAPAATTAAATTVAPTTAAPAATTVAATTAAPASTGGGTCSATVSGGPYNLKAWFSGGLGDLDVLKTMVDSFNQSQKLVKVEAVVIPAGNFDDQVKAAAAAGSLPDILYLDGPNMYNYVWNGNLKALDACLTPELKADLLPSIIKQGTYQGKMYGVGSLDSGLGLYSRKSILQKNGIRIPTGPKDAWTADEFTQALKKLQASGLKKPLDLKVNYASDGWWAYGFSPIIQSAGGDLINRQDFQSAAGVLNSEASIKSLTIFQSWFKDGLVDINEDDNAFKSGRAAISWVGFWEFPAYKKVFADDLLLLPLPNFGIGSRTGMGSWQWSISAKTPNLDAAWSFVNYTLQTEPMLAVTKADGAIPSRKSVIDKSTQFAAGGEERLYVEQLLGDTAVPRPQTPAFPTITVAFGKVIRDVMDGKDVKAALDAAVKTIDQDIKDNQGYKTVAK